MPRWVISPRQAQRLLEILRNREDSQTKRKLAAELAGGYTVVDDKIGLALLCILRSSDETQDMRAIAATALGPALEHADSFGFEDLDDILLSEQVIRHIQ